MLNNNKLLTNYLIGVIKMEKNLNWYHYRQNNSGGSFDYDAQNGISINVYVQAAGPSEADDLAQEAGVYFDSALDCNCCGARWNRARDFCVVEQGQIPAEGEELIRDDNDSNARFVTKWLKDGQFESFVHFADGSFYGSHGKIKHIEKKTEGYGLSFDSRYVGEVFPVGRDGWSKDGNSYAPAPGSPRFIGVTDVINTSSFVLVKNGYGNGFTAWARNEESLKELKARVEAYHASVPAFDPSAIAEGIS